MEFNIFKCFHIMILWYVITKIWKFGGKVIKIEKLNLTIHQIGSNIISVEEGGTIDLKFGIEGRANIQKGYLY